MFGLHGFFRKLCLFYLVKCWLHDSYIQVTGEALYADDTPMPPNGLHAALVLSTKPHARILSIDDSVARSSPGFVGLFLAKDIPGDNMIGAVVADEELFAVEYITCVGQVSSLLNILSLVIFFFNFFL